MPISEAMRSRHTVRRYLAKPLPHDIVDALNERVDQLNRVHNVEMSLILENTDAFAATVKLMRAKGMRNYFILAGKDAPDLEERLGYCSADLMLFAQDLGLNTWWIGGMYSRRGTSKHTDAEYIIGIVAVGYGETQGVPHKSKSAQDVSSYDGDAPAWFLEGVEAALLAPTAMNRQAFTIRGAGDTVSIAYQPGSFSDADLGIVKHHFEQAAGLENFSWV